MFLLVVSSVLAENCEELGGKAMCNEFQVCIDGELVFSDDEDYECCTGECIDLNPEELARKLSYQYSEEEAARLASEYSGAPEDILLRAALSEQGLLETADFESEDYSESIEEKTFIQKYWVLVMLISILLVLIAVFALLYYEKIEKRQRTQ